MSEARERILGRIKEALREKTPRPPDPGPGRLFPELTDEQLPGRFEEMFRSVSGVFHRAISWQEAQDWTASIARQIGANVVA